MSYLLVLFFVAIASWMVIGVLVAALYQLHLRPRPSRPMFAVRAVGWPFTLAYLLWKIG